jgi:hypothetical protein
MELEVIILNVRSQTQRDKYHTILLICAISKRRVSQKMRIEWWLSEIGKVERKEQ